MQEAYYEILHQGRAAMKGGGWRGEFLPDSVSLRTRLLLPVSAPNGEGYDPLLQVLWTRQRRRGAHILWVPSLDSWETPTRGKDRRHNTRQHCDRDVDRQRQLERHSTLRDVRTTREKDGRLPWGLKIDKTRYEKPDKTDKSAARHRHADRPEVMWKTVPGRISVKTVEATSWPSAGYNGGGSLVGSLRPGSLPFPKGKKAGRIEPYTRGVEARMPPPWCVNSLLQLHGKKKPWSKPKVHL